MGEKEEKIRSFFSKELINFMEKEPVQHIECNGEALLIFNKLKLARTDEAMKMLDFSKRLTAMILKKEEMEMNVEDS